MRPPASERFAAEDRSLGRYRLRYKIAEGGMASVHLAVISSSVGFKKWAAVKVIRPELAGDPRFVAMFLDEARLVARIEHPNVCTVFDVGEHEGSYFMAMEYLHGEPLDHVMRTAWNGPGLPREIAARIIADAARGLHAAHELRDARGQSAEVVHRDVSPHNVIVLYEGPAKVVDFGIARSRVRMAQQTAHGEVRGKVPYMSPEQVERRPLDRRSDLFSLGTVLWEATTGRRLFKRPDDVAAMAAVVAAEVALPTTIDPAYPPTLERVVMRALARDPSERYATADEMARDLETYLAESPGSSYRVAEFMRSLFADQIIERDAMLRLGLDTTNGSSVAGDTAQVATPAVDDFGDPFDPTDHGIVAPASSVTETHDVPAFQSPASPAPIEAHRLSAPDPLRTMPTEVLPPRASVRSRRPVWLAVATVAALAVAGIAFVRRSAGEPHATPRVPAPTATNPTITAPPPPIVTPPAAPTIAPPAPSPPVVLAADPPTPAEPASDTPHVDTPTATGSRSSHPRAVRRVSTRHGPALMTDYELR